MSPTPAAGGREPRDGDILIAKDPASKKAYTLAVVPHPPQVRYQTYELAVSTARAWASQHGVAIWLTEDGLTFAPLGLTEEPPTDGGIKKPQEGPRAS